MFKSLQWKIVSIYSLLILFTLQLIGVYVVQALEQYYLSNYRDNLETQAKLLATFLGPRVLEGEAAAADLADLVKDFRGFWEMEIIVLDRYARVLGTSGNQELTGSRLIREEITRSLAGTENTAIRLDPATGERRYYLAFPLVRENNTYGLIYLNGSLKDVDNTLRKIKMTLITGSAVALAISFCLGLILTGTITAPVREVTRKAELMAKGDFSQQIDVVSTDEIGQLGKSFNYLAFRLSQNLREISSEKSKVEAIINYMSDGVVALDGKGAVIHVNPAARKLLKALKHDALSLGVPGFPWLRKLIGPEALKHFLQTRRPETQEVARANPPCVMQVQLALFQEKKGHPNGILVVLHDVTKEKELIARQQEFVADVSHELRTPLTTIKSYVETLLEGAAEEPAVCRRFLTVVQRETERMVSLVKDLLVLSQLDYSQTEWNKAKVDLSLLIQEVVETVRQKQPHDPPSIKINIEPVLPAVYIDRDKIMQVLLNILNNAIKYTPAEGKILIEAFSEGNMVTVQVADTGVGIPSDDLARVFERFYRVEKTRSRDYGGTGLGLPIARRIVEAHGGNIFIDSTLGEGTRVWFTLPLEQGAVEA